MRVLREVARLGRGLGVLEVGAPVRVAAVPEDVQRAVYGLEGGVVVRGVPRPVEPAQRRGQRVSAASVCGAVQALGQLLGTPLARLPTAGNVGGNMWPHLWNAGRR